MTRFPAGFEKLLTQSVGERNAARVLEALGEPPSVSIRLNPSKIRECPFEEASPVPWSPYGYLLARHPVFTLDPLFHAGAYYVQDSSAMLPGFLFRRLLPSLEAGAAVLDLCAAPGGKTTDLAASLRERFGERFTLLANEVVKSRCAVLRANVESWGDPRVGTLSRDPSAFGGAPLFDVVVADVPCSGEGMFRKDAEAVAEWSPETVEFCTRRTRRIVGDIWPALAPGGWLLYATCTFNRLENDDTVAWIAETLGAEPQSVPGAEAFATPTRYGYLMLPGLVPGEGQYAALLRKNGPAEKPVPGNLFRQLGADVPAAALPEYPRVEVERTTALHYLHGDALVLPAGSPEGLVLICYAGLPLGVAKNLGKRCNNLYPKAKRIRMDIR